jgi:hypothetical protein
MSEKKYRTDTNKMRFFGQKNIGDRKTNNQNQASSNITMRKKYVIKYNPLSISASISRKFLVALPYIKSVHQTKTFQVWIIQYRTKLFYRIIVRSPVNP